ncbi:MAG: L-2-amino-thiazoline-4-carboxylic acid hydrolase [Chloroflexi bacterium]|nr:L-2-amino-thiazoline-4-carboxylic acid hydrolase [Chloroflexota bacterium]
MASENFSQEELIERLLDIRARDIITLTKLLVSQVGKEKAKELIRKARWASWSAMGKKAAEREGHPEDLDGYIEAYFVKELGGMPWVPPTVWDERTEHRAVTTYRAPCIGRSIAKFADEEMKELGIAYCVQDLAWAKGFNPDIKMKMTKTYCAGDDCCQFVIEL